MDDVLSSPTTFHLLCHSIDLTSKSNSKQATGASSGANVANSGGNEESKTLTSQPTLKTALGELLDESLMDISNQISYSGLKETDPLVSRLQIEQAVVTSAYMAFLLHDGQVCRIKYEVNDSAKVAEDPADHLPPINLTHYSSRSSKNSSTSKLNETNYTSNRSYHQSTTSRVMPPTTITQSLMGASIGGTASSAGTPGSNSSHVHLKANEAFIIPSSHDILSSANSAVSVAAAAAAAAASSISSSSHSNFGRGRKNQILRGRVSSLIVGSSRMHSFLPASAVPESLIENVQTVLQSKSRSVIIRELQRTNLDVNSAVNNLLQRDDEGDDPTDDEDSYMHGDDLISLLDINSNQDGVLLEAAMENSGSTPSSIASPLDDETFRLSRRLAGRIHSAATSIVANSSSDSSNETSRKPNSSCRMKDHHRWYDSYRDELFASRLNNSSASTNHDVLIQQQQQQTDKSNVKKNDKKSTSSSSTSPSNMIKFDSKLEYWPMNKEDEFKFVKIGAMQSELVALSADGKLHQWKWCNEQPYQSTLNNMLIYHPKHSFLKLTPDEKVVGLSTSNLRASIWTHSNKLASWLDESIDMSLTVKLQQSLQKFNDDPASDLDERIEQIVTSNLYSIIRTSSNQLYWFGYMPTYELRCKYFDKHQTRLQKQNSSTKTLHANATNEISVGCLVQLKSMPVYQAGAIAICIKQEDTPLFAELQENIFSMRDLSKPYKFKLKSVDSLTKMNQSSSNFDMFLNSDSSNNSTASGSMKRKKTPTSLVELNSSKGAKFYESFMSSEDNCSVSWYLNEVIFLDEAKLTTCLGKVIKIDADYVIVKTEQGTLNNSELNLTDNLLDNCRIFQKSQLQLAKPSSTSSRMPDFMQITPKKISIDVNIIQMSIQQNGFNAITYKENSIMFIEFDISNGKVIKEKLLPTSYQSFKGHNPKNISLIDLDDVNYKLPVLLDGNSTFYPLVDLAPNVDISHDSSSTLFKDPQWKNMFPVKFFTLSLAKQAPNANKLNLLTLFSMKTQIFIAAIFRYDLESVKKILAELETDYKNNGKQSWKARNLLLDERCDGNRNIIHAAVFATAPVSNSNPTTSSQTSTDNLGFTAPPLNKLKKSESLSDIIISSASQQDISLSRSSSTESQPKPWSTFNFTKPIIKVTSDSNESTDNKQGEEVSPFSVTVENQTTSIDIMTDFTKSDPSFKEILSRPVKLTEHERTKISHEILNIILSSSILNEDNFEWLIELLSHKNSQSQTPFMYACYMRTYEAAMIILDLTLSIRSKMYKKNDKNADLVFTNMIFPIGSQTSQSPLYVICSNDTCSFTWTGENHITQGIYECHTCSLVGNLCCCSECARICHQGHDCKIKTISPTAYCDCWEKCKCKSLIAGDQEKRFQLFEKLLANTTLIGASNVNGESLFIYLSETLQRQMQEQKNFKRHCGVLTNRKLANNLTSTQQTSESIVLNAFGATGEIGEMPQHDLEPPKFCKRALERLLNDWASIKLVFLLNTSNLKLVENEIENIYLDNQSGCIDLDKFIYLLIVKCPYELLVTLIDALKVKLSHMKTKHEALKIVKRLIKSVVRLLVILIMETQPSSLQLTLTNDGAANLKGNNDSAKSIITSLSNTCNRNLMSKFNRFKTSNNSQSTVTSLITVAPINRCEDVFRQFSEHSIEELANVAQSLIAPVCLGLTKPMSLKAFTLAPNSSASSTNDISNSLLLNNTKYPLAEELLNIEAPFNRKLASLVSNSLIQNRQHEPDDNEVTIIDDNAKSSELKEKRDNFQMESSSNDATNSNFENKLFNKAAQLAGDDSLSSSSDASSSITSSSASMSSSSSSSSGASASASVASSLSGDSSSNDQNSKFKLKFTNDDQRSSSSADVMTKTNSNDESTSNRTDTLINTEPSTNKTSFSLPSTSQLTSSNKLKRGHNQSSEDDESKNVKKSKTVVKLTNEDNTCVKNNSFADNDKDIFSNSESFMNKKSKLASKAKSSIFSSKNSVRDEEDNSMSDEDDEGDDDHMDEFDDADYHHDEDDEDDEDDDDDEDEEDDDEDDEDDDDEYDDDENFEEYDEDFEETDENDDDDEDDESGSSGLYKRNDKIQHMLKKSVGESKDERFAQKLEANNSANFVTVMESNNIDNSLKRKLSATDEKNKDSKQSNYTNKASKPRTNAPPGQTSNEQQAEKPSNNLTSMNTKSQSFDATNTHRQSSTSSSNPYITLSRATNATKLATNCNSNNAPLRPGNSSSANSSRTNELSTGTIHPELASLTNFIHQYNHGSFPIQIHQNHHSSNSTSYDHNDHHSNNNFNANITSNSFIGNSGSGGVGGSGSNLGTASSVQSNQTNQNSVYIANSTSSNLPSSNLESQIGINSVQLTNNLLARVFSILLRQIRELLFGIYNDEAINAKTKVRKIKKLVDRINKKFKAPWEWLTNIMDSTEAQLRFGSSFSSSETNNKMQYLRHLEEKALLANYYNNNLGYSLSTQTSSTATSGSTNNPTSQINHLSHNNHHYSSYASGLIGSNGSAGPVFSTVNTTAYPSSRFGTGIDARRRLNIMQHQHLQYASASAQTASITSNLSQRQASDQANNNNQTNISSQILSSQYLSTRRDFLAYSLSLMRSYTMEHRDALPQIDISSLKHVAYVFDGLIFLYQSKKPLFFLDKRYRGNLSEEDENSSSSFENTIETFDECIEIDQDLRVIKNPCSRWDAFFHRSESTVCIGGRELDPFEHDFKESMPLVVKPHLLQPYARIQDMFKCKSNDLKYFNHLKRTGLMLGRSTAIMLHEKCVEEKRDKNCQTIEESTLADALFKSSGSASIDYKLLNEKFDFINKIETSLLKVLAAKEDDRNHKSKKALVIPNNLMDRWRLTVDLFGRVFCDDVGMEQGSILKNLGGFQLKEAKFRKEMERLRNNSSRELLIEVERDREFLLPMTFKALNNMYNFQCNRRMASSSSCVSSSLPPPMCLSRVKVTFRDEQGEGSGVARSFYTAFSDAILANLQLPKFQDQNMTPSANTPISIQHVPFSMQRFRSKTTVDLSKNILHQPVINKTSFNIDTPSVNANDFQKQTPVPEDLSPLFWEPNKRCMNGFYSPRPGKMTPQRLNAFRNVGRIIGICLLQNELLPIVLSRHVIKFILNRPIKWHDMAFYDADMFESFRKIIQENESHLLDAIAKSNSKTTKLNSKATLRSNLIKAMNEIDQKLFNQLDLTFSIDLPEEEVSDNQTIDLIENGSQIEVNSSNCYEFIKRYSKYRMIESSLKCLEQLKAGVYDVLPAHSLDQINPEDFRLLLNGISEININILASYTSISDESKDQVSRRQQFEKWFWQILFKMSEIEKQELLFFWTGSPYLPASEEGFQPLPTITLRPPSDQHLPTANTCINRLYIPIYSSKSILKTKLLQAIKTKTFGFV